MPRTGADSHARPARGSAIVRGLGFGVALVLGGIAIWLIVTSTDQKRIEIGILAGLWGLLLGAYAAFGTRRGTAPVDDHLAAAAAPAVALELRHTAEMERAADLAARRQFEQRLENLLRHELRESMGRELAALRTEIAALRGELIDKVGGQLRLEHTETTRIIGSDIEALQQEVRQLKAARARAELDAARPDVPAVRPEPVRIVEAATPPPEPQPPVAPQPPPAAQPEPAPEPAPVPVPERADTFAGLPRLTPFTDFALDPLDAPQQPAPGAHTAREGRHTHAAEDGPASGGRRHRDPDSGEDVLARILAREGSRR